MVMNVSCKKEKIPKSSTVLQWQEKWRELGDNLDSWAENYSKVMLQSTQCKNKEYWKQLSLSKSPYLQDVEVTSFGSMKYQPPNNGN